MFLCPLSHGSATEKTDTVRFHGATGAGAPPADPFSTVATGRTSEVRQRAWATSGSVGAAATVLRGAAPDGALCVRETFWGSV